jgi:hypothetical protein
VQPVALKERREANLEQGIIMLTPHSGWQEDSSVYGANIKIHSSCFIRSIVCHSKQMLGSCDYMIIFEILLLKYDLTLGTPFSFSFSVSETVTSGIFIPSLRPSLSAPPAVATSASPFICG